MNAVLGKLRLMGIHLLAVLTTAGCGVRTTLHREAFDRAAVQTIAVLPFSVADGDSDERRRAQYVRQVFVDRLSALPYAFLETSQVDRRIRGTELSATEALNLSPQQASRLRRALRVDAVLLGELSPYYATNLAVYAGQRLAGRFRLISLKDAAVLWEAEHTYQSHGGLLVESGQVIRELRRLANSSDEVYMAAVAQFVDDVVGAFPRDVAKQRPRRELKITSFRVKPTRGAVLRLGDRIDFRVDGTPGMRVVCTCGPSMRIAMFETAPGIYEGSHVILAGEQFETNEFSATLSSPFRTAVTVPLRSERPITADTRAPRIVSLTLRKDRGTAEFRVDDPADAARFRLERRGQVVAEADGPSVGIPPGVQPGELRGVVLDSHGNRSAAVPLTVPAGPEKEGRP